MASVSRTHPTDMHAPPHRYNAVARALHWGMAALILLNLTLGLLGDAIKDATGFGPIPLHKSIGITLLVLILVRIGWRIVNPPPPQPRDMPRTEARVAAVVHGLLYALMLVMPLTGYIFSSAGKYPTDWFGLFTVPRLPVAKGDAIVDLSHGGHEILGWVMLLLAAGHIAAALRHHFILRDGVLKRMLG